MYAYVLVHILRVCMYMHMYSRRVHRPHPRPDEKREFKTDFEFYSIFSSYGGYSIQYLLYLKCL